jgi:hypothetical protein
LTARVLLLLATLSLFLRAEGNIPQPEAILNHFCAANRAQEKSLSGASMEVEMEGYIPRLEKHGKLHALRRISPLGFIKYDMLRFEGDRTVNKEVIQRYLKGEAESQQRHRADTAVTPDNYKFKYKGTSQAGGREVYVFQVTPRQKRENLFKGEVWIDSQTYLRVQESGYLVKNPSIFIRKVAFIRKYVILGGISVPKQVLSIVDTRVIGKAQLTIDYSNFEAAPTQRASAEAFDQ